MVHSCMVRGKSFDEVFGITEVGEDIFGKTFGKLSENFQKTFEKTFQKLLKNETNTLPKRLVSSVKKEVA